MQDLGMRFCLQKVNQGWRETERERESLLTLKISVNSRGGSWESYEKSQARCEHSKLGSTHFTQTLTSVVQEDLFLEVKSVYEHHELVAN